MNCENAKLYYYDYLEKRAAIDPDVIRHLESCPDCQRQIDCLKDTLQQSEPVEKPWRPEWLGLHYQLLGQWLSCDMVRPFLPSLLIEDLHVTGPTPVTAHIDNCPSCQRSLHKIASLNLTPSALVQAACYLANPLADHIQLDESIRSTIDSVRNQKPSDIRTRMQLTEAADTQLQSDAYAVDVKRRHTKQMPAKRVYQRRAASAWVAGGIAAAVVFAILLVLPARNVQAVDIDQLYMTLDTVQNVHIQKFSDSQELESIWISEGLGAYMFQQPDTTIFVNKNSGKVYQKHQGTVQLVSRGGEMELERPWGLLPFKNIAQLPPDYEWEHVSNAVLENGLQVRIYEWRWSETPNSQLHIKHIWRGYLDPRSFLPYKVECLDAINDMPLELIMEMRITYPSDSECGEIFRNEGFEHLVYGVQDEAFNKLPAVSNTGCTDEAFVLSTWPSAKVALNRPE